MELMGKACRTARDWVTDYASHRTGARLREVEIPFTRLRMALAKLWLAYPCCFVRRAALRLYVEPLFLAMSCFTSLWRCPEVGLPVSRCPEKTGLPDLGGKNDHACNPLGFPSTLLFFVELPFSSKSHPGNSESKRVSQLPSSSQ